jgi:hypothetical protein
MPGLEDDLRELLHGLDDRAYEDLVAFVVMAMGKAISPEALSARLLSLLERFSQRAGIAPADAEPDVRRKITTYYREHPLDAVASKQLELLLRRALREEGRSSLDFARLLGRVRGSRSEPEPRRGRAGPLARVLLGKPDNES